MPTPADFLAGFALSGEVCGAGLGTEPGAWVGALGDKYVDNELLENTLIRYFGFVAVTFRPVAESISINLHELPRKHLLGGDLVPAAIAERYGDFPDSVPFTGVADRIVAAGAEIQHVRRVHEASLETYWVPAGRVMFSLISPYQVEDRPELRLGDISTVSTDSGTAIRPEHLTRFR